MQLEQSGILAVMNGAYILVLVDKKSSVCCISLFYDEKPGRVLRVKGGGRILVREMCQVSLCLAFSRLHCVPCFLSCLDVSTYFCLTAV